MPRAANSGPVEVSIESVGAWRMRVTTYRLDDRWVCQVDNVQPGAVLARAESATRETAVARATARARRLLGRTRTRAV